MSDVSGSFSVPDFVPRWSIFTAEYVDIWLTQQTLQTGRLAGAWSHGAEVDPSYLVAFNEHKEPGMS